jgi:aminopeptidase YwaD
MMEPDETHKDIIDRLMGLFQREFSGEAVKNLVTHLSAYHRIQLSPGYRDALKFCHNVLNQHGLAPEVLSYFEEEYWGWETIEGWVPKSGRLEIQEPADQREILADFAAIPISLVQRSPPINLSNVETVVVDDVTDLQKWEEHSLKGKLILSNHANLDLLTDCAIKFEAVGILTDRMMETPPVRYTEDLPHARLYSSFWWSKDQTNRIPGFVISPQRGRLLRKQLQKGEEKEQSLRFNLAVDAEFIEESIDVLSCCIEGSKHPEQEIIVIAHLCHPNPGANDNASGAALAVGLATFLQQQIDVGNLTPPKRTIRFLLVPEMTGTVPFLAHNQDKLDKFIAGVNLDMVGQNQVLCRSPLLIEGVPKALPTYVNALFGKIAERLPQEGKNFAGAKYPLYQLRSTPFSGGSDHLFLNDCGIGTVMLIHWPDLYYHTTEDTPDKVDPEELKRVGALAGVFALLVADLESQQLAWLSNLLINALESELNKLIDASLAKSLLSEEPKVSQNDLKTLENHITNLVDYYCAAVHGLYRAFTIPIDEAQSNAIKQFIAQIGQERKERLTRLSKIAKIPLSEFDEAIPSSIDGSNALLDTIFQRRYPVPVSLRPHITRLDFNERFEIRKKFDSYSHLTTGLVVAQYWIDGERPLSEVVTRTMQEVAVNKEGLLWGLDLLRKFGLITPVK